MYPLLKGQILLDQLIGAHIELVIKVNAQWDPLDKDPSDKWVA